jgi:hypothetical protein
MFIREKTKCDFKFQSGLNSVNEAGTLLNEQLVAQDEARELMESQQKQEALQTKISPYAIGCESYKPADQYMKNSELKDSVSPQVGMGKMQDQSKIVVNVGSDNSDKSSAVKLKKSQSSFKELIQEALAPIKNTMDGIIHPVGPESSVTTAIAQPEEQVLFSTAQAMKPTNDTKKTKLFSKVRRFFTRVIYP